MSLIRTTYYGRLATLARETNKIASKLAETQMEAITGYSVTRPSDDPGHIGRIHGLREQLADQEVWQSNSDFASSIHSVADEAISSIADALARARELATQYASETYSDDERQNGSPEVEALLETIVEAANAHLDGRYVFAGTAYDTPPYIIDPAGTGLYIYDGSTEAPTVLVGDNITVQTGWDGSDALQGTFGDVVGAVEELIAGLNDTTGAASTLVQDVLDDLDAATEQLGNATSALGAEMNMADDARELSEQLETELSGQMSNLTEANVVDAYTRLTQLQVNYEAALQITTNTSSTLLFSRL